MFKQPSSGRGQGIPQVGVVNETPKWAWSRNPQVGVVRKPQISLIRTENKQEKKYFKDHPRYEINKTIYEIYKNISRTLPRCTTCTSPIHPADWPIPPTPPGPPHPTHMLPNSPQPLFIYPQRPQKITIADGGGGDLMRGAK